MGASAELAKGTMIAVSETQGLGIAFGLSTLAAIAVSLRPGTEGRLPRTRRAIGKAVDIVSFSKNKRPH